jgi:hypothetical protein
MGSIHLIKFPDRNTELRAMPVFHNVPVTRVRFPNDILGVTDEHIQALKAAKIPFQYVSKEPAHAQKAKTA